MENQIFELQYAIDTFYLLVSGALVMWMAAGGSAALAGVLLLGARKGKYSSKGYPVAMPGANLPLATLGTFILWMGWFGFNGGSVLKLADAGNAHTVAMVFLNTNMAAAAGLVGALLLARALFGKADLTMALNGAEGNCWYPRGRRRGVRRPGYRRMRYGSLPRVHLLYVGWTFLFTLRCFMRHYVREIRYRHILDFFEKGTGCP